MARVDRFEDLAAWQKARELNRVMYRFTREGPISADRALVAQIRRSSVSVMANLAEGFERGRRGEFHQFVSIAKGSCAELRSHLYAALDAGYVDEPRFRELRDLAEQVARIIGGLRAAIARHRQERA